MASFASIWRWLRQKRKQRPDLRFILFTRKACPLCDEAADVLRQFQERYGFALESRDVDADPRECEAFGKCVPVVSINGRVRFRGQVNQVLLQRILEADVVG